MNAYKYHLKCNQEATSFPFLCLNVNSLSSSHSAPWQKSHLRKFRVSVDSHFLRDPNRAGEGYARSSSTHWDHSGVPTITALALLSCFLLMSISLCLCHCQKHSILSPSSHLPLRFKKLRRIVKGLHIPYHAGQFLDSPQERVASVSQTHLGPHHSSPSLGPGMCKKQEFFSRSPFSPIFLLPP